MDLDEITATIDRAIELRIPRFAADDRVPDRIGRLEDYLLACAYARGDLEAARRWLGTALWRLEDEWEAIQGWNAIMRTSAREPTQRAVTLAKRELRGDLYDSIRRAKADLNTIADLIRRFELDERTTSRVYTLMTGNQ